MDSSPTSLFVSYEHDFHAILAGIKEKLEGNGKDQRGEQRRASLRRVELDLDEAEEMIAQMELEIQGIPKSVRTPYGPRLKNAKAELVRYKKLSKDTHAALSRGELLASANNHNNGYNSSDDPYGTASDRTRLLAGTETLQDGNRRLTDIQRIALDTEAQGADVLSSLRQQREQIEHSRTMLQTADTSVDRASGTVKTMLRRMSRQRLVMGGLIAFLIAVVALILWFKLFRR